MKRRGKSGQVWIETVIYTLIGLTVMGLLLAFAKPKIDAMKDRSIIEQTISSLTELNTNLNEVQLGGPENSRQAWIKISKGVVIIDPALNKITWKLDSSYKYSQPGYVVSSGELKINTTEKGSNSYSIEIFKTYSANLTINNASFKKEIAQSPSPYSFIIKNRGIDLSTGNIKIDITV